MAKNLRLSLALGIVITALGSTALGMSDDAYPLKSSLAVPQGGDRCQSSTAKSDDDDDQCPGEIWMGGSKGCGCAPSGSCSRAV